MGPVLFLPGASGDPDFWGPVADRLPRAWEKLRLGWPGLGDQPPDPSVRSLDDLAGLVVARLERQSDLVAQSMGAVVAVRVAAQHPGRVRRIVLAATSGGLDMTALGAAEWRDDYRGTFPRAAGWITDPMPSQETLLARVAAPALLLAGAADPVSPVAASMRMQRLLQHARVEVVPDGSHDFAREQPDLVARLVAEHLDGDGGS